MTDPTAPGLSPGFNPANGVPVPSSSNSTDALRQFLLQYRPQNDLLRQRPEDDRSLRHRRRRLGRQQGVLHVQLRPGHAVALRGRRPAARDGTSGANFATPSPILVEADDKFGNIATTYNGPVTISLANGATGFGGTITVNAVAGVATFTNLSIAQDGTYNLLASSPGLATTNPPSTSIYIVGAGHRPASSPNNPRRACRPEPASGSPVGANDFVWKPDHDLPGERDGFGRHPG